VVNQQVILLGFNKRTSETVRDITFMFDNYLNQNVKHKKINKRFLEWFIGFTEGKGSFLVKNNKVYFDISINIKDIQVIYYIKKELGFGKVLIRDLGQYNSHSSSSDSRIVSFYITSADNFSRLVSLFNGNLCTVNKKQEFQTWLNVFNNQYSKKILFVDRIIKASLNTGWLSGYIDAMSPEVCSFTGLDLSNFPQGDKYNKELNSKSPFFTFFIFQKEFNILNDISLILNVSKNIKYCKHMIGWELRISSLKKVKWIVNYLKRYPLKTKKSFTFTKWCKIYNIILKKEHLNLIAGGSGLNKIHSLSLQLKEMSK